VSVVRLGECSGQTKQVTSNAGSEIKILIGVKEERVMDECLAVASGESQTNQIRPDGRYIYCVAPIIDLENKGLRGIGGSHIYQIAFQDIGAIVHDCPVVPYQGEDEVVKAWLLEHHSVIDAVWEFTGTVLPMTFDVIIKGGETCGASDNVIRWLKDNYVTFKSKLESFQQKVELRIQVIWDRAPVLKRVACEDPEVKQLQAEMDGKPQGMAFFYKRKIEKRIKTVVDELADSIYQNYLNRIQALVSESRIEKPKRLEQKEMLLNLSVLAAKERIGDIGNILGELQGQQGIDVYFTGPWPPYSFVAGSMGVEEL